MPDTYSPALDSLRSWHVGVLAARELHRATVKAMLPALRRNRYQRKWSRPMLATMLGVAASTLEAWELGNHLPPPDIFSRWRDLLGV